MILDLFKSYKELNIPAKYSVVSLFCGAGGLDYGFHRNGFHTIWANDFNKWAIETMQKWTPDTDLVLGDVTKVLSKDIPHATVMLGGFPCQGFSQLGNRDVDDSRNFLYREYIRILKQVKPLVFIGENVEGMLTMAGGAVIDKIINDFAEIGYNVNYTLLSAVDYGVAQDRKRVIIEGWRKDISDARFSIPLVKDRKVMRDVLWGLPEPDIKDIVDNRFSPRFLSINRKRDWDEPSYTILAGSRGIPIHPGSPDLVQVEPKKWILNPDGVTRRLSWQEAALIQSFPYDFPFQGNLENKYKQIGNAVPPLLAGAFAVEIYKELERLGVAGDL